MANIKHVNSVVDRDFRNRINQLIDVVNSIGTSLNDLVVKGVMTTDQYSQLIYIINGLVKMGEVDIDTLSTELKNEIEKINNKVDKGNVSVADINKNLGKIDQTFLSDELLQQIAGNAPINAVPADGSLTTKKYADESVTLDKTDFKNQVTKIAKNIIENSGFTKSENGLAENWETTKGGANNFRISSGRQYWTPLNTGFSSAMRNIKGEDVFSGHKYYISFEQSNVMTVNFSDDFVIIARDLVSNGRTALIHKQNSNSRGIIRFYPRTANVESSVKNVIVVDLTETFGSGNEPTVEYFEYLMNLLGAGKWFDGTLNLTDATKNGIVTARELNVYDPNDIISADNVNDALLDLADGAVKAIPGKNLYNPDNNVLGTLARVGVGVVQTIIGNPEGSLQYSQKIKMTGGSGVTLSNVVAYSITNLSDVVIKNRLFIGGQPTTTIPSSELPDNDYHLWVSVRAENVNSAQVEKGLQSTSYEPYKPISAVYANGVKLFDYPLEATGGGDKKKEIYDLAKANLEKIEMNEKISYLSNNAEISNKVGVSNPNDTQTIPLKDSVNAQKMLLHLHKREKEVGFGAINDAYLPNAKNDFSDVRITDDNGKVLPYRVIHRADDFDIVPYNWTRKWTMASPTFTDSEGRMYQADECIRVSTDKGNTWTNLPALTSFKAPTINLVAQDDTLYFNHDSKLYRSEAPYTDYQMVLDLNPTGEYSRVIISGKSMVQHNDGELFAGLYQGEWRINIYKSIDNGLTWQLSADLGDKYQHVHGMFADPHTGAIYAGLDGGGGVLKTTDKGATWIDLREEYPDMPKSTDYGVRYSDPSGYRLLGGETPIVGGHSIIKTFDDENFTTVLNDGISVNYVIKLGNRMFATGSGSFGVRNGAIYVSRDDAENWEGVYRTGPITDLWSANDGYRYMEKMGEDEIFVGPQSFSRPPLRIFGSGHYAEIIIDVPAGTDSITVESGHSYPNELPITHDTMSSGDKLVHFELNENDKVIKELVSGDLFEGDFNWVKGGKRLSYFYPYINPTMDGNSAQLKSLTGYDIDPSNFDVSTGATISFWAKLSAGTRATLFENDKGDRLEIVNGYQLHLNGSKTISFNFPVIPEPFIKHDILIKTDGNIVVYTNGLLRTSLSSTKGIGILNALSGTESIKFLNGASSNPEDAIQHFMIRKGLISEEQLLKEFNSGITDNVE